MDSLVSCEWLAAHLGDADLVVVDASKHLVGTGRDAKAEFRAGHIPGARFLDLGDLSDPASPIGTTLPGPDLAARVLGALGLTPAQRVVLYDASAIKSSARAWLILSGYGFRDVAILDGGLAKWRAEGRALETGDTAAEPARLKLPPFAGQVRRKADMLANIASGENQVVDARDPDRFTGAQIDAAHNLPGGHIPGARNLHFATLFAADGTFLDRDVIAERFAAAGIDGTRPLTASCGSGVTASVLLFALHLMGRKGALYDGSWSEWGTDPDTPKETGPAS